MYPGIWQFVRAIYKVVNKPANKTQIFKISIRDFLLRELQKYDDYIH
mgnify:CR=1 FL=1